MSNGGPGGVLGQARFVVSKKLKRRPPTRGYEAAVAYLEKQLAALETIEPTPEEIGTSAELEFAAQKLAVALDSGESLLAAVTHSRALDRLFTGDKRAIEALEALLKDGFKPVEYLAGRLACLEQGFIWLLKNDLATEGDCRNAVCLEKQADIALAICFSCSSPEIADGRCHEGLRAYVEALRSSAPTILSPG